MKTKILTMMMGVMLLETSVVNATIEWDHWSPLTVIETITATGDGKYLYEYSFTNVDTSPIWGFGVYTTFAISGNSTFVEQSTWMPPRPSSVTDMPPEYDARNLDISIIQVVGTAPYYLNENPNEAIQLGVSVSGFSFSSSICDSSPKYYFYETIASGYAVTNGTGRVAAVGLTPEPTTLLLFGLGVLVIRKPK
jgi:hypothetical protein